MVRKRRAAIKAVTVVTASLLLLEAVNRIQFQAAEKKNPLSCEDGEFHLWKRGTFFYRKKLGPQDSEQEKLLLIHELSPDCCADHMELLAEALAKNTCVYSMDLLGCGRSDKPPITYTAFLYVLQIKEMAEQVIGQPVHLIAEAKSADLALAAAHYCPECFTKITLLSPVKKENDEKDSILLNELRKAVLCMPIFGSLIYHYAFLDNGAANAGGTNARFLYASILGHYTDVDGSLMKKKLAVPCRTVNMEDVERSKKMQPLDTE